MLNSSNQRRTTKTRHRQPGGRRVVAGQPLHHGRPTAARLVRSRRRDPAFTSTGKRRCPDDTQMMTESAGVDWMPTRRTVVKLVTATRMTYHLVSTPLRSSMLVMPLKSDNSSRYSIRGFVILSAHSRSRTTKTQQGGSGGRSVVEVRSLRHGKTAASGRRVSSRSR